MAPVRRPNALKTIILTPAKLLYKKLRPRSEPRARKRLQISLDSAEPICSHEEKSSIGAEERSLRDLCIEYAADYCDSVRSAIEEIDGLVKAFEGVWDLVCSGSLTAAGQLANAKRMKLQIIDISSLTQLRERYTAIGNSLWQKPGMSCRYHLDVADVHRALVATQCAIIETLRKLMIYLDGCRMPTQAYGVRCKLEVRENLTEANATCIKISTTLQETCLRYGTKLTRQFEEFSESYRGVECFLYGNNEDSIVFHSSIAQDELYQPQVLV